MARRPRLFGEGLYHHIYAWGNNRQAIFPADQYYRRYLDLLETHSAEYRIDVIAYALMRSHVHIFVHDRAGTISQFMNCLHGEYAQYFNRVTGNVGHVFGERFNNKIVQANVYGLWLSRYIHRQAVEADLVTDPKDYPWTSYQVYTAGAPSSFVKPEVVLEQFGNVEERSASYRNFVSNFDKGPVDWDVTPAEVIGDETFRRKVQRAINRENPNRLSRAEIVALLTTRFVFNPNLLLSASGRAEKSLRRQIITYLITEVGCKRGDVARLFNVSNMTIHKALAARLQKFMPQTQNRE